MFRKLRWQFIATTMGITLIVLLLAFTAIYSSASHSFYRNSEPPRPDRLPPRIERLDPATRTLINDQRREQAQRSLNELLGTLLVSGAVTLVIVFVISYFVANRAVGVIEQAYLKQRRFIADASHELKTPLATISANTEAALSDAKEPSKWLTNIKEESERMATLVNDLLRLARADQAARTTNTQGVDLARLITKVQTPFQSIIAARGLSITAGIEPHATVMTDADTLQQLLTILFDNATKYTPKNGAIDIVVTQQSSSTTITLRNDFHAVDASELTRFFERFYQADSSHHDHGSGLGLAIATGLAKELGVELEARSTAKQISFHITYF